MNIRLRLSGPQSTSRKHVQSDPRALEVVHGNPLLEDYLDHLLAPMVGVIPYAQRSSFMAETRAHLEASIEEEETVGMSAEEATKKVLKEYGSARQVCNEFLMSWFESTAPGPIAKMFGYANGTAFAFFGLAQFFYIVFLQLIVFLPSAQFYALPIAPARVREVWPEPLPYPEVSVQFFFMIGFPVFAPLIAGWLTGMRVPVGAAKAVYHAMMPILVYSFAVGALLLPKTEALLYALFQLAFWLPAGAWMAHVSSRYARGKHR